MRARTRSSWKRTDTARAARAAAALVTSAPSSVLDQRVAAGERALGVVGGERQRQALEVARARATAPSPARSGRRRGCAGSRRCARGRAPRGRRPRDHQQTRGGQLAALGQAPRADARSSRSCWCSRRAVAGDVLGRARGRARPARGRARSRRGVRGPAGGARRRACRRAPRRSARARPPRRRGSASSTTRRRRRRSACDRCGGRPRRSPGPAGARRCGTASRRRRRTGRPASRRRAPRRSRRPRRTPPGRCSARVIAGAAWRSCTGAKAHTSRPAQPRRRSPASTSSRALPPSPVTTPIERGSAARRSCFCGSNRPSAASCLRSRSSWASRSPSPATRSSDDSEGEVRRGLRAARVVVAAARHDHLRAVGQRLGPELQRLELVAPHRARHRAALVAQLEVHARAARPEVPHLAEQLHARERAQPVAQLRGVACRPGTGRAAARRGCPPGGPARPGPAQPTAWPPATVAAAPARARPRPCRRSGRRRACPRPPPRRPPARSASSSGVQRSRRRRSARR